MEICYCKKDFKKYIYGGNENTLIIFEKDKYYKFYFEEPDVIVIITDTVWVIYDENGERYHQGLRFHGDKKLKSKRSNLFSFYNFFEYGRILKLRELNKISVSI